MPRPVDAAVTAGAAAAEADERLPALIGVNGLAVPVGIGVPI